VTIRRGKKAKVSAPRGSVLFHPRRPRNKRPPPNDRSATPAFPSACRGQGFDLFPRCFTGLRESYSEAYGLSIFGLRISLFVGGRRLGAAGVEGRPGAKDLED